MTDHPHVTELVTRFRQTAYGMQPSEQGNWVCFSDYQNLAAWLINVVAERDQLLEDRDANISDDAVHWKSRAEAAEARLAHDSQDYVPAAFEAKWPDLALPNRSQQFIDGAHWGIRKCIGWLHARAGEMRDPDGKARDILNATATNIGMWKGWNLRNRKDRSTLHPAPSSPPPAST
jgi:hypothetical protein